MSRPQPLSELLPLAVRCAVRLDDSGTLCPHLLGACPDHPVCGERHPITDRPCLRRGCAGRHDADGNPPWCDTEEDA